MASWGLVEQQPKLNTRTNSDVEAAPGLLSDADDTAKSVMSLELIGQTVSPEQLIYEFETTSHFKTYSTERNPSFSANCNVLCALLYMKDPSIYMPQYVNFLYIPITREGDS